MLLNILTTFNIPYFARKAIIDISKIDQISGSENKNLYLFKNYKRIDSSYLCNKCLNLQLKRPINLKAISAPIPSIQISTATTTIIINTF